MSDGGAHRRIQSMRLSTDLPEARQALSLGMLSLSAAASLQNYFRKNKKTLTLEDKQKLLREVQGKSKSECERILYPQQSGTMLRFLADEETVQLLKRLSELTAISEKDTATLIKRVSKVALRALDPMGKKTVNQKSVNQDSTCQNSMSQQSKFQQSNKLQQFKSQTSKPKSSESKEFIFQSAVPKSSSTRAGVAPESSTISKVESEIASPEKPAFTIKTPQSQQSRYIAVGVERAVWTRDSGQCAYIDPISKRRCTSRYGLQLDHIIPFACGGPSTLDNLRLMCKGHNTLAAQQAYGKEKMMQYI